MSNDEIIVTQNILNIKINKNGDEIKINIDDRAKMNEILRMFKEFFDTLTDKADANTISNVCENTENNLKKLFGDDILIKIFETEHPSVTIISLFLAKLLKVVKKSKEDKEKETINEIEKEYSDKYFKRTKLH